MRRAITALLIGSALVGCGDADSEKAERPKNPPWEQVCDDVIDQPASPACAESRSWRCGKAEDRLERGELHGRSVEEAHEIAARHGCVLRVVERDGEDLVVTMDYRGDRINVAVKQERVVRVKGIG